MSDLAIFSTDVVPTRSQLLALQDGIVEHLEPIEEVLEHHFIPGVYARKLTLPAGTVIAGKVHRELHMCIVAKGHILVAYEAGKKELFAGDMFVSEPGFKRVGYCIEETVFINIHTNDSDSQDLAVLEAKFIEPESLGYTKVEVLT